MYTLVSMGNLQTSNNSNKIQDPMVLIYLQKVW